jgi:gamma-glutamylputrescine oxidase
MAEPNGPGHPDSYYVATAIGMEDRPVLDSELTADVCVIGGGFTGLSAALNLAEQGMDVVLLEAERIGFGASGRQFGIERSKELWDFAERAKDEIRSRVEKHEIDCDLQKGQVLGVHKKSYLGYVRELADVLTERYDYPFCQVLNAEEAMSRPTHFLKDCTILRRWHSTPSTTSSALHVPPRRRASGFSKTQE